MIIIAVIMMQNWQNISTSHAPSVSEAVFTERFLSSALVDRLVQQHPTGWAGACETVRMPIAIVPTQISLCNSYISYI